MINIDDYASEQDAPSLYDENYIRDYGADTMEEAPSLLNDAAWETTTAAAKLAITEPLMNAGKFFDVYAPDLENSVKAQRDIIHKYDAFGGNRYGSQMIRHLPETAATLALPLGAYSFALAPVRGGASWMAGGAIGVAESQLYDYLRTGDNMFSLGDAPKEEDYNNHNEFLEAKKKYNDNWKQHLQVLGSSAMTTYALGKLHRGFIDAKQAMKMAEAEFKGTVVPVTKYGKTKNYIIKDGKINGKPWSEVVGRPNTVSLSEIAAQSANAAMGLYNKGAIASNTLANYLSGASKASVIAGGGLLALSPSDSEAGMLNTFTQGFKSAARNIGRKPISSAETAKVMEESAKVAPLDKTAQAVANEEKLVVDYDSLKNIAIDELPSDFIESIGKEFARHTDSYKTGVDTAMDDIISSSHYNVKNKPVELESFYAKNIDDAFPLTVEGNQNIRNSLGEIFRTGNTWEDLRTFMNEGTLGAKGYARHKLEKSLSPDELKAVDDFIKDAVAYTKNPATKIRFEKNPRSMIKSLGVSDELVDELAEALEIELKAKGFDNISDFDMANLKVALERDPQAVRTQFGARADINQKTENLIKSGELKEEDAIFGYVKPKYETKYKSVTLTPKEYKSLLATDKFKRSINKIFGKDTGKIIKAEKNKDGTYSVLMEDKSDFIQGALPPQVKELRGVTVPIANVPVNEFKDLSSAVPSKINVKIVSKDGNSVMHNSVMNTADYIASKKRIQGEFIDHSTVIEAKRPLTSFEQDKLLGVSHDIGDLTGHTVASVQRSLGKDVMYRDIRTNYSTAVSMEDIPKFMSEAQTDPKYLFVNPDSIDVMNNKDFMQFIANNYVKVNDLEMIRKTGARYVQKKHVYDLLGYNKTFITRDKYSIGRFIEESYQEAIEIFRGAVIIKNPVALVNNTVGMAFTNHSYMYMNYGKLSNGAFAGMPTAFKSYKEFKSLQKTIEEMRSLNVSDIVLKETVDKLERNMAYQLYKRGGLQSLLDDGLLTTRITKQSQIDNTFTTGVKNVFLTEDSSAGAFVRGLHDQSDITNRVNLFSMLVAEGKGFDEAARITTEVSVSYSRLLSPSMMFARNNGIVPFITWYTRIAPVMVNEIIKNPMRFAQLQGMYLATVTMFGSENQHGDDYIGGVRVESYNWFNALSPENILDPVSMPALSGTNMQMLPKYMSNDAGQNLLGVTTK